MARSLLDDSRYDSIGRGRQAKSSGAGGDKAKLIAAIALFAVAGGVLAWYYELIPGMSSAPPPPVVTPEQQQAFETQEKQRQEAVKRGEVTIGGD